MVEVTLVSVFQVHDNLYGIDLFEERRPGRSSAYLVVGSEPILVETGSAASHEALVSGLAELGMHPADLRHIVITHVHLDHAGGVGQMMAVAPQAVVHCHPRAARHLIDPTRLERGARLVYGQHLDTLFGSLLPVPEERVVIHADESVLRTRDRTLVFFDTPGHAKHHVCVLDENTRGLFSGDTVGIRYTPEYTHWDFLYGFPTTSPSDFDPDVMLASLNRLEALGIERIYHTHFGVTDPAADAFAFSRRGVTAIKTLCESLGASATLSQIEPALRQIVADDLAAVGHPGLLTDPVGMDITLNSQGILVYLQKKMAGKL